MAIEEVVEKCLLKSLEKLDRPLDQVNLKSICDRNVEMYGESGDPKRREIQIHFSNIKRRHARSYCCLLAKHGIPMSSTTRARLDQECLMPSPDSKNGSGEGAMDGGGGGGSSPGLQNLFEDKMAIKDHTPVRVTRSSTRSKGKSTGKVSAKNVSTAKALSFLSPPSPHKHQLSTNSFLHHPQSQTTPDTTMSTARGNGTTSFGGGSPPPQGTPSFLAPTVANSHPPPAGTIPPNSNQQVSFSGNLQGLNSPAGASDVSSPTLPFSGGGSSSGQGSSASVVAHFPGTKLNPYILHMDFEHAEAHGRFDIKRNHMQVCNGGIAQETIHIKTAIGCKDFKKWKAYIDNLDQSLFNRAVMIQGPSRDSFMIAANRQPPKTSLKPAHEEQALENQVLAFTRALRQ